MNFIQFKSVFSEFSVFSTADIRIVDPNFDRRRLSEWQDKGYIRKIIKGMYIFSDVITDEALLFRIANRLYRPSYVSLESALVHYHCIPEVIYGVTSISTRRTYRFDTFLTHFSFRTISPRLLFGYLISPQAAKIAFIEKALLDFLYLNPVMAHREAFDSLRIDRDALTDQLNEITLSHYLDRFNSMALSKRVNSFLEWLKHA